MHDPKYRFGSEDTVFHRSGGYFLPDDEPLVLFRGKDVGTLVALEAYLRFMEHVSQHADTDAAREVATAHAESITERLEVIATFQREHPDRAGLGCHTCPPGVGPHTSPPSGSPLWRTLARRRRLRPASWALAMKANCGPCLDPDLSAALQGLVGRVANGRLAVYLDFAARFGSPRSLYGDRRKRLAGLEVLPDHVLVDVDVLDRARCNRVCGGSHGSSSALVLRGLHG